MDPAETGAAVCAGARLVRAVEPLEHPPRALSRASGAGERDARMAPLWGRILIRG